MTPRQAIDFVRRHGVVLEAAKGSEPPLAERIAGEPIRGSWWAHPKGHEIFELTRHVRGSSAVLVCTLARGRMTYVHRRLWPAFVRLSGRFPAGALDMVREVHTESGRHVREDILFPEWVPKHLPDAAAELPVADATDAIQVWLVRYGVT